MLRISINAISYLCYFREQQLLKFVISWKNSIYFTILCRKKWELLNHFIHFKEIQRKYRGTSSNFSVAIENNSLKHCYLLNWTVWLEFIHELMLRQPGFHFISFGLETEHKELLLPALNAVNSLLENIQHRNWNKLIYFFCDNNRAR